MKKIKSYKSYIIPDDGFDVYMFALNPTWVAIKYGKNDAVATRGTYSMQDDILKRKGIKELTFSDPGFDGIGRYIISEIFSNGQMHHLVDMIGKE